VNRRHHTLLAPLIAVLALLLGLAGVASAAFNAAATDPHYGIFLPQLSEAPARMPLEIADPTRENGVWLYDSTLGVPVYVRQNPWTYYDPHGLSMGSWISETLLNSDTIKMGSELVTEADYSTGMGWAEGAFGVVAVATNVVDAGTNLVPGIGQLKGAVKKQLIKALSKELLEETAEKVVKEAVQHADDVLIATARETAEKTAEKTVEKTAAKSGETAATKAGRQAHKDWDAGEGFEKEVTLPSGKRADGVNFEQKHVKELKPNNPRAVKRGEKQVEPYRKELQKEHKGDLTSSVETYDR